MRRGVLTTEVAEDLAPERREFAQALRGTWSVWPEPPSLRSLVKRLAGAGCPGLAAPAVSRYFSGRYVPSEAFVRAYYQEFSAAVDVRVLPISLDRLLELRHAAEAADGRRGVGLRQRVRVLEKELEAARRHPAVPADEESAPLPVSAAAEDRRNFESDESAGPEYDAARSVAELVDVGDLHGALTILEGLLYVLSPGGVALCFAHLHRLGQADLLANLLSIYHRDRPVKDVVALALALKAEFPEDADRLLGMIV